ncbi:MAG: hypothetical protein ACPLPR_08585 [Bacillota bacterium]
MAVFRVVVVDFDLEGEEFDYMIEAPDAAAAEDALWRWLEGKAWDVVSLEETQNEQYGPDLEVKEEKCPVCGGALTLHVPEHMDAPRTICIECGAEL